MKIAKIALIHLQSLAIAYLKKMYRHQLSMKFSFHLNKQGTNPTSRIGVFVCALIQTSSCLEHRIFLIFVIIL